MITEILEPIEEDILESVSSVYVSQPYGPHQTQLLIDEVSKKQQHIVRSEKDVIDRIQNEVLKDMDKHFPNVSVPQGPHTVDETSLEKARKLFQMGQVEGIDGSMVSTPVATQSTMSLLWTTQL